MIGTVSNVISQVIMERLTQFRAYQDGMSFSPTLTIAEETSQMAIDDNLTDCRSTECMSLLGQGKADSSPLNCAKDTTTVYQTKLLKYLVNSYNRSLNEENNYPKVRLAAQTFFYQLAISECVCLLMFLYHFPLLNDTVSLTHTICTCISVPCFNWFSPYTYCT